MFDVCGNTNFYLKNFVLDGGTLATSASMSTSDLGLGNVTLVADSTFRITSKSYMMFSAPNDTEKIDLGGHTLTVSLVGSSYMCMQIPVINGTVVFSGGSGGYLRILDGMSGGSQTVNLEMDTSAMYIQGEFSVSNYVANYTDGYNISNGTINVYGTFTPAAKRSGKDAFFGPKMQDSSLIDLSAKTNAFSVVALGFSGSGYMSGNRTMTFADGAKVGVLLGERKLANGAQIIDWSAAVPENRAGLKFYGEFADGSRINLMVRDDGVYAPKKGITVIVR